MRRFLLPITLSALLSCSVKEQRDACPCRLEMDLSAFREVTRQVHVDTGSGERTLALSGGEDLIYREELSRRQALGVSVWCELETDSLYLFCQELSADRERLSVQAVPYKQFATVELYVMPPEEALAPVTYTIQSDYGAIDVRTGKPVKKDLSIPLGGQSDRFRFRLPRQDKNSHLVLLAREFDGRQRSYPLGQWVRDSGYDWQARDLDDLFVGVDFSTATVQIRIDGWQEACTIDEIL